MKFKVGDKVKIRTDSEYFGLRSQSHTEHGEIRVFEIIKIEDEDHAETHIYKCKSITDKYRNSYKPIDIEMVEEKKSRTQT